MLMRLAYMLGKAVPLLDRRQDHPAGCAVRGRLSGRIHCIRHFLRYWLLS